MLGIFKTSIVKSRFQHEASMASEIEECSMQTWFQNLVMFTYELGNAFLFFMMCLNSSVYKADSINPSL